MLKSKRNEITTAFVLMAPFVIIYAVLFIYPTIQMVRTSFTDAPLMLAPPARFAVSLIAGGSRGAAPTQRAAVDALDRFLKERARF